MIRFHLGVATVLFLVESFVFNLPALSMYAVVIFFFRIFFRSYRATTWRYVLTRFAIYLGCFALVIAGMWAQNQYAESRMSQVIAAVESYHLAHGSWPAKLDDAISPVPRAKFTLLAGRFDYRVSPEAHTLEYVKLAPFGRVYYVFEQKRRGYLD